MDKEKVFHTVGGKLSFLSLLRGGGTVEQKLPKKRILILGGTLASYDTVRIAQSMGFHVTVTDDAPVSERISKQIADDTANVSTADIPRLLELIKEREIEGVFCGPSEFNIRNMIRLCGEAGLPCYATEELWSRCADKTQVKAYCRKNGVCTPEQYSVAEILQNDGGAGDDNVKYPVVIKPADGCSSKGITVCYTPDDVKKAVEAAESVSVKGNVFAEEYIDNGGRIFSIRYIINEGKAIPYLALDTYVADPKDGRRLISALSRYPSELYALYLKETDAAVRRMLADMGLKNGMVFLQMLPHNGKFYCTDMGFRLSGGFFYTLTERLMGINDIKMMLRFATGGQICTAEEAERLNSPADLCFAQLTIPLEAGVIGKTEGAEAAKKHPLVTHYLQYYNEGDEVKRNVIGTLGQHFARISVAAKTESELLSAVKVIRDGIHVTDTSGNEMYVDRFDLGRLNNR